MTMSDTLCFSSPLDKIATLEKGIVTFIYGPPAVGKTNVCMCALRFTDSAAYVDTEGGFSTLRAQQLGLDLDKILYKRVSDFRRQHRLLTKLKLDCELLVVDSMVMLYRLQLRSKPEKINSMLAQQMAALSAFALEKNAAVLVTGQVYRDFHSGQLNVCGGDVLKYWPKTIIELSHSGRKKTATLNKHRSMPEAGCEFLIRENGLVRPGLFS